VGLHIIGDENDGGSGFGGHAHVHEPDFAVARVHLPSRMSSFSCSTSRDGSTSAQFSCALAFEKFQIMEDFAHHGFGLVPDFFDQNFLHAHGLIIRQNSLLANRIALRSSIPK
jgi:hypothetical protein